MNRRDRVRTEERKKESDQKNDPGSSNSKASSSKNLMDSYFQSQQVIQSLSARSESQEIDFTKNPELPKSFRIPRKQSQSKEKLEERDRSRSKSPEQEDITDATYASDTEPVHPQESFYIEPTTNIDYTNRQYETFQIKQGDAINRARRNKMRLIWKKQRLGKEKLIEVFLFDRSRPDGKIAAMNVPILVSALADILKRYVLSGTHFFPNYLGHSYEDGVFLVMCATYPSTTYLKKEVSLMEPPWPGAELEVVVERYKECIVSAVVPTHIHHLSEFFALCKEGNRLLGIEKWRRIACEELPGGLEKVYTIGMDSVSYELIKLYGNVVSCGDKPVKIKLIEYNQQKKKRLAYVA